MVLRSLFIYSFFPLVGWGGVGGQALIGVKVVSMNQKEKTTEIFNTCRHRKRKLLKFSTPAGIERENY